MGFPDGSDGKESACNARDLGSIPELGRFPGGGHGNPLQYSCLENPHGQRSLASYSLWGCKETRLSDFQFQVTKLSVGSESRTASLQNAITEVKEKCPQIQSE